MHPLCQALSQVLHKTALAYFLRVLPLHPEQLFLRVSGAPLTLAALIPLVLRFLFLLCLHAVVATTGIMALRRPVFRIFVSSNCINVSCKAIAFPLGFPLTVPINSTTWSIYPGLLASMRVRNRQTFKDPYKAE